MDISNILRTTCICYLSNNPRAKSVQNMLILKSRLPTNADTVLHSGHTSPLQALTSKVVSVSGLSPAFRVMTVVVVDPSTVLSLQQPFSFSQKRT